MKTILSRTLLVLATVSSIGIASAQQVPSNLSAVCSPDGSFATMSWSAVPGASAYAPRLNNLTNDGPLCDYGWACGTGGDWFDNFYTSTTKLASVVPGQPYMFWVHSFVNGSYSEPAVTSFTCQPPGPPPPPLVAPTGLQKTCNASGTQVTLSWNAVPGATGYAPRFNNPSNDGPACSYGWFCSTGGDFLNDNYGSTSYTSSVVPGQQYGFWVHSRNATSFSDYAAIGFSCQAPPPPVALNTVFDARTHEGVYQITANGTPLLAGCGFSLIGSVTGADTFGNITSCRLNPQTQTLAQVIAGLGQPAMTPISGGLSPFLPHSLTFPAGASAGTTNFSASVTTSGQSFAVVTFPMDGRRDLFTHYRYSSGAKTFRYDEAAFGDDSYILPDGQYAGQTVRIHKVLDNAFNPIYQTWGEMISSDYTVRYTLTGQTRSPPVSNIPFMTLSFVNHPAVNNVEFSFIRVNAFTTATAAGNVTVSKTDPAVFFMGEPGGVFRTKLHPWHQLGRVDQDGWSVNTANDTTTGFMSYGPYTSSISPGWHTANFRLMLDNVFADNNQILTLEVYDAASGAYLNQLAVHRRDFFSPFSYQDFSLSFFATSGQKLEFRTYWHGGSYVRQERVYVN
jgi:hypothetical protein